MCLFAILGDCLSLQVKVGKCDFRRYAPSLDSIPQLGRIILFESVAWAVPSFAATRC